MALRGASRSYDKAFTYGPSGELLRVHDRRSGATTTFTYLDGRLVREDEVNARGGTTTRLYSYGQMQGGGKPVLLRIDTRRGGRPGLHESVGLPDHAVEVRAYYADGGLATRTVVWNDSLLHSVEHFDAAGRETERFAFLHGRVVTRTEFEYRGDQPRTFTTYDKLGRLDAICQFRDYDRYGNWLTEDCRYADPETHELGSDQDGLTKREITYD